jgi:hypothetical protein
MGTLKLVFQTIAAIAMFLGISGVAYTIYVAETLTPADWGSLVIFGAFVWGFVTPKKNG